MFHGFNDQSSLKGNCKFLHAKLLLTGNEGTVCPGGNVRKALQRILSLEYYWSQLVYPIVFVVDVSRNFIL